MRTLMIKLALVGWCGIALAQGPATPKVICAYGGLSSACHSAQMLQLGVSSSKIAYALAGKLRTLNPIIAHDQASVTVLRALHAGLLEGTVENPEPAVAFRFAQSADRSAVTFALRQGLRFSDGTPVTTEDVRFTFERLIYPHEIVTSWRLALRCADGALPTITALNPVEIQFSCKVPMGPWQLWQIGSVPILPKSKLQRYERDPKGFNAAWSVQTPPSQIAGLGPFRLESLDELKLSFGRNPHYWKIDVQGTALPYLAGLTVFTVSPELALQKFRARETHFLYPRPTDLPILQSDKAGGRLALNDDLTNGQAAFGGQFLVFNWDASTPALRAVFRTTEFRRAISSVVPRTQIVREVFLGGGVELYGPVSPASPYFVGRPGQDPRILERFQALQTSYNPQKAVQILESLGLKDTNNDGVREIPQNFLNHGNPPGRLEFEIMIPTTRLISQDALTRLVLSALARVGIRARLVIAGDDFWERLTTGRYESALVGWDGAGRFSDGSGDSLADHLLLQQAIWLCAGSLHLFHRTCPKEPTEFERRLDELWQRIEESPALHDEAQLLIVQELPVIPFVQVHGLLAYRTDVLRNHERRPTLKLDVLFCPQGRCSIPQ